MGRRGSNLRKHLARFEPVHVRQGDIQKRELEAVGLHQVERRLVRSGPCGKAAHWRSKDAQGPAQVRLVIHNEVLTVHRSDPDDQSSD